MDLIDRSPEDVIDYESPAKVLALGPSAANPCPGFSAIPETCDLIDFSAEEEQPSEPPAKGLASEQNITELCPAPTAAPGRQYQRHVIPAAR